MEEQKRLELMCIRTALFLTILSFVLSSCYAYFFCKDAFDGFITVMLSAGVTYTFSLGILAAIFLELTSETPHNPSTKNNDRDWHFNPIHPNSYINPHSHNYTGGSSHHDPFC